MEDGKHDRPSPAKGITDEDKGIARSLHRPGTDNHGERMHRYGVGEGKAGTDQELVLEKGVVLQALRGAYQSTGDCLFSVADKKNVAITGQGATLRMWRGDYARPPYKKSEFRHAINIHGCDGVRITGLTIAESGGDGIYLGVSVRNKTNRDVLIKDVVCDRNYRQGIDLEAAVAEGSFREDLLYRLNVITVKVPPLRTRGMDILLLAEKYIELYASRQGKSIIGMTNATAQKLLAYRWPGNVRELRNAMEHAVTLTNHRKIIPDDLPEKILTFQTDQTGPIDPAPHILVMTLLAISEALSCA